MGRNGYTRQTYNARLLYRRRVVLGNKQLTDNFKVLEQRQKSLDVPRPLAQGKNNRSMQNLISSDDASSKKDEEAPAIIVFVVGGMTYSEIRSVDIGFQLISSTIEIDFEIEFCPIGKKLNMRIYG